MEACEREVGRGDRGPPGRDDVRGFGGREGGLAAGVTSPGGGCLVMGRWRAVEGGGGGVRRLFSCCNGCGSSDL